MVVSRRGRPAGGLHLPALRQGLKDPARRHHDFARDGGPAAARSPRPPLAEDGEQPQREVVTAEGREHRYGRLRNQQHELHHGHRAAIRRRRRHVDTGGWRYEWSPRRTAARLGRGMGQDRPRRPPDGDGEHQAAGRGTFTTIA